MDRYTCEILVLTSLQVVVNLRHAILMTETGWSYKLMLEKCPMEDTWPHVIASGTCYRFSRRVPSVVCTSRSDVCNTYRIPSVPLPVHMFCTRVRMTKITETVNLYFRNFCPYGCSSVGIATGYALDGPGIESWLGGGGEIFRTRSDRPWGIPRLLFSGHRVSLFSGKAVYCVTRRHTQIST
jgi:hypothetical protein